MVPVVQQPLTAASARYRDRQGERMSFSYGSRPSGGLKLLKVFGDNTTTCFCINN